MPTFPQELVDWVIGDLQTNNKALEACSLGQTSSLLITGSFSKEEEGYVTVGKNTTTPHSSFLSNTTFTHSVKELKLDPMQTWPKDMVSLTKLLHQLEGHDIHTPHPVVDCCSFQLCMSATGSSCVPGYRRTADHDLTLAQIIGRRRKILEDDDDELPEINRYLKNSAADGLQSLVFDHSLQGILALITESPQLESIKLCLIFLDCACDYDNNFVSQTPTWLTIDAVSADEVKLPHLRSITLSGSGPDDWENEMNEAQFTYLLQYRAIYPGVPVATWLCQRLSQYAKCGILNIDIPVIDPPSGHLHVQSPPAFADN
ncbi:hypothetical protein DFH08DRAFT_941193 [Mycena albidolilacea]|uniref:Uncharacterized protein n=1 Tax=Mycena albidolilacea TaxID=1033008 RepID=A0AAD6ZKK5_9AGAR|nr:hypothetical protein DFH08DRAFT_941193 [Mycena albidolilacea]